MESKQMINGAQQRNGGNGRGLKALLIGGLLAATLTMSAGLAVVGTAAAAAGITIGGMGVAYGACQRVETDLATDLGGTRTCPNCGETVHNRRTGEGYFRDEDLPAETEVACGGCGAWWEIAVGAG